MNVRTLSITCLCVSLFLSSCTTPEVLCGTALSVAAIDTFSSSNRTQSRSYQASTPVRKTKKHPSVAHTDPPVRVDKDRQREPSSKQPQAAPRNSTSHSVTSDPRSPVAEIATQKLKAAIELFQEGFYENAEIHFRNLNIRSLPPDSRVRALVYAAACCLLNGRVADASTLVQAAYRTDPRFISSSIMEPFGPEIRQQFLLMIR